MAGQPVLGGLGPGRFGIEVAGERQTADEHAGLARSLGLGAYGQRHAGIVSHLAGGTRSMLPPHPGFDAGAGVVQEVAPELAVAVAVPCAAAELLDQHRGPPRLPSSAETHSQSGSGRCSGNSTGPLNSSASTASSLIPATSAKQSPAASARARKSFTVVFSLRMDSALVRSTQLARQPAHKFLHSSHV